MSIAITATARSYPRLPYEQIKNDILGTTYDLSLAFVGEARAAAINKQIRDKDYVPNVLSIPFDTKQGEIIIAPIRARREAPRYNLTPRGYIGFLYIHGLLHLKGLAHGTKMDRLEETYLKKYKLR